MCYCYDLSGLRGAPGYSLEQAHHLPIEMDPLIGQCTAGFASFTCLAKTKNFHPDVFIRYTVLNYNVYNITSSH